MRLYHLTNRETAEYVRANGFDDHTGLGDPVLFLSYRPKGGSSVGAHEASSVLAVEMPEETAREHRIHGVLCADAAVSMYLLPLSVLRSHVEISRLQDPPVSPG